MTSMLKELTERDVEKLLVVWQCAITIAHGQVKDIQEGSFDAALTQDKLLEMLALRIQSYMYLTNEDLKDILLKYIETKQKRAQQKQEHIIKKLH